MMRKVFQQVYSLVDRIIVGQWVGASAFAVFASVLNIGLDLLFVIPLQIGVTGVALATILSHLQLFYHEK
jgi:Na+-driven multidrug efflux pump